MSRRRGLIAMLLIGVVVGAYLGLFTTRPVQKQVSYWAIDDRTLGVIVLDALSIKCAVSDVTETAQDVRIDANCAEPFLSTGSAGAAQRNEFQIELENPLANRSVFDGLGNPARRCSTQQCAEAAPG